MANSQGSSRPGRATWVITTPTASRTAAAMASMTCIENGPSGSSR